MNCNNTFKQFGRITLINNGIDIGERENDKSSFGRGGQAQAFYQKHVRFLIRFIFVVGNRNESPNVSKKLCDHESCRVINIFFPFSKAISVIDFTSG